MSESERDEKLLSIGKQCSHPSCLQTDFLPLPCISCHLPFCSQHFRPDLHSCSSATSTSASNIVDIVDLAGIGTYKELIPSRERNKVIESERHMIQEARRLEVADRVRKMRERLGLKIVEKVTENKKGSKKESEIVRLIKLRQRAKAGNKNEKEKDVKRDDKLWVTVVWVGQVEQMTGSHNVSERKELWFRKNTTIGKAIDLLSDQFQLVNVNNSSMDKSKMLHVGISSEDNLTFLEPKDSLGDLFKDGDEVLLLRGDISLLTL